MAGAGDQNTVIATCYQHVRSVTLQFIHSTKGELPNDYCELQKSHQNMKRFNFANKINNLVDSMLLA